MAGAAVSFAAGLSSAADARFRRPPALLWLSVAVLLAAAFLIVLPAVGAPSAGDVCNAGTLEQEDELAAEKNRRATIVLAGAGLSLIGAIVGFVAAVRTHGGWRWLMALVGVVGIVGAGAGLFAALVTALIVC